MIEDRFTRSAWRASTRCVAIVAVVVGALLPGNAALAATGQPPASNARIATAIGIMNLDYEAFSARVHSGPFDWSNDGCTSPVKTFSEMFGPACNLHDFGYRNFGKGGAVESLTRETKDWIDERFHEEMNRICANNFGSFPPPNSLSPRDQCMQVAEGYWAAVSTKGDPYFF